MQHTLYYKHDSVWHTAIHNLKRIERNVDNLSRYKWIGCRMFGNISALIKYMERIDALTESYRKQQYQENVVKELLFCFKYKQECSKSVFDRLMDFIVLDLKEMLHCSILFIIYYIFRYYRLGRWRPS